MLDLQGEGRFVSCKKDFMFINDTLFFKKDGFFYFIPKTQIYAKAS